MTTVADLMTAHPISVTPDTEVTAVLELMETKKIRHLLVVGHDGELLGVLSQRDLGGVEAVRLEADVSGEDAMLQTLRVEEIYTRDPETVDEETPLAEAAQILLDNKFGCLPVVRKGEPVGILTESDFVKYALRAEMGEPLSPIAEEYFDLA